MALSKTTKDHDEIKQWAEQRGAVPGEVEATETSSSAGILRFMFPKAPNSNDGTLKEISWDDFFEKFDASGLELLYQDVTKEGAESNFNRLIYPENESTSVKKSAGKKAAKKAPVKKSAAKKAPAKTAANIASSKTASKPASKTTASKTAVTKSGSKTAAAKKTSSKSSSKVVAPKSTSKKKAATKPATKASSAKTGASKTAAKKTTIKATASKGQPKKTAAAKKQAAVAIAKKGR